jgi:hypothetical protein
MPERIVVNPSGRTTITPIGPVGPPGPPGPRGSSGGAGRHGYAVSNNGVNETIESVVYQVLEIDITTEAEVALVQVNQALSHTLLLRVVGPCDVTKDQVMDCLLTGLGDVTDWVFKTEIDGVVVDLNEDLWAKQTPSNRVMFDISPAPGSILGEGHSDFWYPQLLEDSAQARYGFSFIEGALIEPEFGEPYYYASLCTNAATSATVVVVVPSDVVTLRLKTPSVKTLVPIHLSIVEIEGGSFVDLEAIEFEADDIVGVSTTRRNPAWFFTPNVISLYVLGVSNGESPSIEAAPFSNGQQNIASIPHGGWSYLHRTSETFDATLRTIGSTWTVGRCIWSEDAQSLQTVRVRGVDGGDTGALLRAVIVPVIDGSPRLGVTFVGEQLELTPIVFPTTEGWMDFVIDPPQTLTHHTLLAILFQTDSDLAEVAPVLQDTSGIDYGCNNDAAYQGYGVNTTTYGTWPETMTANDWRPYVLFQFGA